MIVYDIKIYFDTICAWSYIGHRILLQAIDIFKRTYPGASSDIWELVWVPLYRDRSLPAEGVPLQDRLIAAFGDTNATAEMARVQRIDREHGINFNLSCKIGQTQSSHRLIWHALEHGGPEKQQALLEKFYFQWFQRGEDITSHEFLQDCATAVGLDPDEASHVLFSGMYTDEVHGLDETAREVGISSVPTFDINTTRIEGAEDLATFYETFVAVKESENASNTNLGL